MSSMLNTATPDIKKNLAARSLEARGRCRGFKLYNRVSIGRRFLFTCSDTFAVGCVF